MRQQKLKCIGYILKESRGATTKTAFSSASKFSHMEEVLIPGDRPLFVLGRGVVDRRKRGLVKHYW